MAIPLTMLTDVCSYYCFVVSIAHISLKPDGKLVVLVVTTNRSYLHQNLLPGLDLSLIAKTLQRGDCRHRDRGSFLKRTIRRFQRHCVFRNRCVLGTTSRLCPEHLISWLKLGYVVANGFYSSGDIIAESRVF